MTEAERIEKTAEAFAFLYHERNRVAIIKGYVTGATAENERLQQQLKEKDDMIEVLKKAMKQGNELYANLKFDDEPFTPYQVALQQLKSAQELNQELVDGLEDIIKYSPNAFTNNKIRSLINKAK